MLTPGPSTSTDWRTPAKRLTQFEPPTYGSNSGLTPPKRPSPMLPNFLAAEDQAVPRLIPVLNRLQISSATMSPTMMTSVMSSTASMMPSTASAMTATSSNAFASSQDLPEGFFSVEEDFETETQFKSERDTK